MSPVLAIALFAHEYGVTCRKCHTVIPHLTPFGARFLASGDRIPGISSGPALPLGTKFNLAASSANQGSGPGGAGLPKAIVDEIELFSSATLGSRASYFVEQYLLDGGEPGALREAWIDERLNPWTARIPLYAQAGLFTLPLPVDPETFRETAQHYTVYDQTVGSNPFAFFDPKLGIKCTAGDTLRGLNAQLFAGPGYDRFSGLPKTGIDTMAFVADAAGPVTAGFYLYRGSRPVAFESDDRFIRRGYSLVIDRGKWTSESVVQTGWDSNAGGGGASSSGGFAQLRYAFDSRLFALARYEGTDSYAGAGFSRDAVVELGYAPSRNARITLEDVIAHVPATTNTLNLQVTIGY